MTKKRQVKKNAKRDGIVETSTGKLVGGSRFPYGNHEKSNESSNE